MSYTTALEVQSDFKNMTFGSTGNITSADVDQFIVEADALIDSYLGNRYVTPVLGNAVALALLKLFSRTLVADRIRGILEVKQAMNRDANQSVRGGLTTKDVLAQLKAIRDRESILPGAEELASGGGFYSNNAANDIEPVMKKDEKQW